MKKELKKLRLLILQEIEFLKKNKEKKIPLDETANIIAWQAFLNRFNKIIGPEKSTKKKEKEFKKKVKLPKLKVGDYFKQKGASRIIYKVTEIPEKNVVKGKPKVVTIGMTSSLKTHVSNIEVCTKKQYKEFYNEKPTKKAKDKNTSMGSKKTRKKANEKSKKKNSKKIKKHK